MWLFGRKKKKKAEEKKRQEELVKQVNIEQQAKIENQIKAKKLEPKKPTKKTKVEIKKVVKTEKKTPLGKYEIYPEAGLYKFRLKASNGEILVVSFGYSTQRGAKNGIETFKKAVLGGNFEISTDKSNFSHFDLFGSRSARVIASGEFYKSIKLAESAVESVKKFYSTNKVFELDNIPSSEIREEFVIVPKVEENSKGKFILIKEGKYFMIELLASNSQILLVSQKYASKQSALNGLEVIKKAINARNFTIYRDKQNRYQYNLYSTNKQLIVSGETYPVKQNCLSSIQSVIRFAGKAKLEKK